MIHLDADCTSRDDVTYVRARVTNERGTPQAVRLRSRLDGPVWAPTAGPVTSPEWADSEWEGVLEAGQTRGVGFASSAPPIDDPIELVAVERATEADDDPDPTDVLSGLESSAPPSDVISHEP